MVFKRKRVRVPRLSLHRLEQGSQRVFKSESRAGVEEEPSEEYPQGQELLIAVIALGVITIVLIIIIIYGYCKFVRKKREEMDEGGRGRSDDKRESSEDPHAPPSRFPPQENLPHLGHLSVPVKMRKRSMTFTETDEECRKYREDLVDSCEKTPETEKGRYSRKKSVVTFADEQKINSDGM